MNGRKKQPPISEAYGKHNPIKSSMQNFPEGWGIMKAQSSEDGV